MTWAWLATEWAIRIIMVLVILRRRFAPTTALAWLTLIFFVPVLGLLIYLMLGVSYLGRRRARYHERLAGSAGTRELEQALHAYEQRPALSPEQQNMIRQAEQTSGNNIVTGNALEFIVETPELVDRLIADIDQAQHHVHVIFYIYWPDHVGQRFSEALIRAAQRGVHTRVLADAAGSRPLFRSDLYRRMQQAGVQIRPALPVRLWRRQLARIDLRNHRKIVVIDGCVAYTGSHNIVRQTYGSKRAGAWIDLSARLRGPSVAQLQMVFLDDWLFDTSEHLASEDLFPPLRTEGTIPLQVVPTGPEHHAESFHRVLVAALNAAQRQLIMTTPYLVPDEPTLLALAMAADRGVDTSIIVPARNDHPLVAAAGRWYFEQLLEAGVKIHRYHGGMLHAKTLTIDDAFGLLGSANIDVRSFFLNFEINVLLYGSEVTAHLRFAQRQYLSQCTQVRLDDWRQRPMRSKYAESAAALLSPLL